MILSGLWKQLLRPRVLFGVLVAGTVAFLGFQWKNAESEAESMRDSLDAKRQRVAALSDSLEKDSTYRTGEVLRRLYSRTDFTALQDSLQEMIPETVAADGLKVEKKTKLTYEASKDTLSGDTGPTSRSAEEWTYDYEPQTARHALESRIQLDPQTGLLSYRHVLDPKSITIDLYSTVSPQGVSETFADVPSGRVTGLRSVRRPEHNQNGDTPDRWEFGAEANAQPRSTRMGPVVKYEKTHLYGAITVGYAPEFLRPEDSYAVQPFVRVGVTF